MPRVLGCTGAANVQDERAEKYSCMFCTSTIHGGRMPRVHGCTGAANVQDERAEILRLLSEVSIEQESILGQCLMLSNSSSSIPAIGAR